jgi:hypothetical protein
MTFKKVLIGLLAGITSGTFLGIHLTSDKSIETRRMVLGKGEHYLDEADDKFRNALSRLGGRIKNLFKKPRHIQHYRKQTDEFEY